MSIHVRETARGRRYDVKLRSANGQQHSKTFSSKRAATEYEARQMAALADGVYVAPSAGATSVSSLAERWLVAGSKRESTRNRDRTVLKIHVLPGLGLERTIRSVTKADCQALVDSWSASGQAPRTVLRQHSAMRAMFRYAIDCELLVRNPAVHLRLPHADEVQRPSLSGGDLERLAETLGAEWAPFMWCGALLGLRWAETAGLTAGSLDLAKGVVRVVAQIDRHGQLAPPKTAGSVRTLAAPAWLLEELATAVTRRGPMNADQPAFVFTSAAATAVSYTNWRARVWVPATRAAGLPDLRYHDLRSLAASALVASGVDLRTAMHRLGHTTPAMTLAVYARVAADRDREAADAVAARIGPRR